MNLKFNKNTLLIQQGIIEKLVAPFAVKYSSLNSSLKSLKRSFQIF